MKPTRGLPGSRFVSLPHERRMALVSIAVLVMLLGAIVLYQKFQVDVDPPLKPEPIVQPPLTAEPAPASGAVQDPLAAMQPPASPESTPVAEAAPPSHLTRPLAGLPQVIKHYGSLDRTYDDFRQYNAIAYAAEPGQAVLAAAKGTVEAVEEDPADGTVLLLRHTDTFRTRYAGLGKVLVTPGTQVEAGAIIAQVGPPTPARAEMGPHLAFEVWRNDLPVDPTTFVEE